MNPNVSLTSARQRRLSAHAASTRDIRRTSGNSVLSGDHGPNPGTTHTEFNGHIPTITEEINEIKRYDNFTTIDWVQDAVHEQARRRAWKKQGARSWDQEGAPGWRRKVSEAYDAGQAWVVVTIVGIAIGLNAAFLNIVTEWLADIKLGYCTTAFYLNEAFCCWEAEQGKCPEWRRWSTLPPINYVVYFLFAILFAFSGAVLIDSIAPYAAGSGISEIKVIIAGFIMKGFLGARTLLIKSIGLPLAIASGLSVGKEGPSVHIAVCTGNVISRWFSKYRRHAAKTREILTATSAAGVAVAFGSPIGGVLFSLEEMASHFPLKTLWRSYFCALVATSILAAMNPFRTGQIVMFQVKYDRTWHFFELIFFVLLGIFGGLYGAFVMKWNLRAQAFRKKYLSHHPVLEATVLAGLTALICYPNMFMRITMTEMMEILFRECEGKHDYNGICQAARRWSMVFSLFMATILRVFFVIISYGCKVPAGIFVPSMAIGASFGRMVGILVQALQESFPDSRFFSSCEPDVPCITPGTYAFLGAGAALSGIMHLTISVTVIMFELTGALTYILPTMIVVGVTKAVSDRFGRGGIADRMIWFNGFPFLDSKEEHIFNVPVSHAMTNNPVVLPAADFPVHQADQLLENNKFQGFPIVEDLTSRTLIGFIGRTEFQYALSRAKREGLLSSNAKCRFVPQSHAFDPDLSSTPPPSVYLDTPASSSRPPDTHLNPPQTFDDIATSSGTNSIDLSLYVDVAPITVHPRLPLETVMEIFKKMGPRVILVEHRGRLSGLVTVKDCLKYQFKVEHQELAESNGDRAPSSANIREGLVEQKAWEIIQWIGRKVPLWRKQRTRWENESDNAHRGQRDDSFDIIDGIEDIDGADGVVELEERDDARLY
ncbi:glycerol ethanol, ferric requiring protein [Ophidiomyces ophidiicola]|uniref:Glycerol ethanol, ferric requiring protein n=1 Tax=Ophidiomyces ophidiicola TaxID=1387563 RepID=A0ACB8USF5_9EURO|nr:glycerol ethanol, ferric requiring protein [Ophidiomyces ophidiicola]KAI1942380.1 glycerol ethanol, ferric requiring protein [Ophidiomyces ophidiicola]KAI2002281.1 glycerol ethanol, ferric requiring protein [Ophidiomyces ophidiicola]KAI2021024.1 glycerol ethanol, ferric requiring protein [Ophidiomyces ophidiicola]KAI2036315.1 glycerol ethanol, ferric requiring protein [Ophidiomyces ophidiicola]